MEAPSLDEEVLSLYDAEVAQLGVQYVYSSFLFFYLFILPLLSLLQLFYEGCKEEGYKSSTKNGGKKARTRHQAKIDRAELLATFC